MEPAEGFKSMHLPLLSSGGAYLAEVPPANASTRLSLTVQILKHDQNY